MSFLEYIFNVQSDTPQSIWNEIEQKLLTFVDKLVPYVPFINT